MGDDVHGQKNILGMLIESNIVIVRFYILLTQF